MYLLDTNVFISAKNFYYGFDFHPGFWDWLTHANREGRVFSTKKVYDEICRQEDHLTGWARDHKDELFLDAPPDIDIQLKPISDYIKGRFGSLDIRKFVRGADYYLIGHALTKSFKVVTHETYQATKAKIKIPQMCQEFEVECLTPFDMLRRENARFIWNPDNG